MNLNIRVEIANIVGRLMVKHTIGRMFNVKLSVGGSPAEAILASYRFLNAVASRYLF